MTDTTTIHGPTFAWVKRRVIDATEHNPRKFTRITIKPAEGGGYDGVITWRGEPE